MPLVAHNDLPTFERLRQEGRTVLQAGRAHEQDIREMHIGILNMMPDAALAATERQLFRLVGESNQIAQFYIHPFTLPELPRSEEAKSYIERYYQNFEDIKKEGLDALIITGANVTDPDLRKAPFWEPLQEVMAWSWENVTSTLCSCLSTHAVMEFRYGQKRTAMKNKLWGVYKHRVLDRTHPLVRGVNTNFDLPHSRFNDISRDQFETAGMKVLVAGEEAGVHMAVSEDLFRIICFQGHPEYDTVSLLKEYKREIRRYAEGDIRKYPPFPANYFNKEQEKIFKAYKRAIKRHKPLPPFPDKGMEAVLENTWRDTTRAIVGNWIGKVYQLTNVDRQKTFMEGVDPNDPLGIRAG